MLINTHRNVGVFYIRQENDVNNAKVQRSTQISQKEEVKNMAEETRTTTTATEGQQAETNVAETQQQDNTPSVDELMAQLAAERAEKERYKTANDKLSKEAADTKRQLRAKQTAEEQEAEAQAEAQRLAEEEREALRKENNRFKAMAAYKSFDEKTVDKWLEAVSEADHATLSAMIETEKQKAVKEAQAEWMKSRPPVNAGQYPSMTKEQIMAIADRDERRKAMAQNMDLFR